MGEGNETVDGNEKKRKGTLTERQGGTRKRAMRGNEKQRGTETREEREH